ncbi:histidine phosphatase family protein [Risungbinella massiliensis]|uniref:histidine phosphatase family protein n=1 Tax=Risungbinella massiliensis TaxID=1329796 RepID=UPI002D798847|nr:histidine phosphatase family protein [Risungbinella massiliensis]
MDQRQNIENVKRLSSYHFAQEEHFKRLKRISANNLALYDQYASLQYLHKALAHRYKAIIAGMMSSYTIPFRSQKYQKPAGSINQSLLNLLREGGYILYVRHGEANVGEDQPNLSFEDCSTQRNLSDIGRRQAVTYGEVLRRLSIPIVYPVLVSPFCRNRETATLAFGEENVQVDPFWVEIYKLSGNLSKANQESILNYLRSVLEIKPPMGSNKVIIAHSFPKGVGLGEIPDMGTVVVEPQGQGNGYKVVAQISLVELANIP